MHDASIHRFLDLPHSPALLKGLDEVFFASSNTQTFASPAARAEFRERWLGRYLTNDAQFVYLALQPGGAVAGYLAGCLDDPALTPRFSDIGYFAHFAELTRAFPAHLHVNLKETCRNQGLGSALISRFTSDAASAGAPGVHVVTSRGSRNVPFYSRNGFHEAGSLKDANRDLVFLAKRLS